VFRTLEIKKYGRLDVNGVKRAKWESVLSSVQIFIDCGLIGYIYNHLAGMSWADIQSLPILVVIFDCLVMLFSLSYIYVIKIIIQDSETVKNMFTLHTLQKNHRLKKLSGNAFDKFQVSDDTEEERNSAGEENVCHVHEAKAKIDDEVKADVKNDTLKKLKAMKEKIED